MSNKTGTADKPALEKTGVEFFGRSYCTQEGEYLEHKFVQLKNTKKYITFVYYQAYCTNCGCEHAADYEKPVEEFEAKNSISLTDNFAGEFFKKE